MLLQPHFRRPRHPPMTGPFAPNCIVLEVETKEPTKYLRIRPERLPGDAWIHQPAEFDRHLDREAVIDRYALSPSDEYVL